jgi:hypothetical protein
VPDQSYIGESADQFGSFIARLRTDEEVSKRAMRRAGSAVAVALLHVAFVFMLIWAEWIPTAHVRPFREAPLLWLLLPRPAGVLKPVQEHLGKEVEHTEHMTVVQPITPPEPSNAINPAYALGQALACGASSYEHLSEQGRAKCKGAPWHYKFDRNGVIVLDSASRPVQEDKPRQSDIQAHERSTAPECPKYIDPNAPCLSAILPGQRP